MSSSPGTEVSQRLKAIADDVVVVGAFWDPLLHPRGRDGKFIKKNGWIRGLLTYIIGGKRHQQYASGRVAGFSPDPKDPDNPWVIVQTRRGPALVKPRDVAESRPPKGNLHGTGNDPWHPKQPPLTSEQKFQKELARVNAWAANLSETDPEKRSEVLNKIMSGVRGSPLSTIRRYNERGSTRDEWDPDRMAKHEAIWQRILTAIEDAGIERDYDALALGGLPGAGKSTSLKPGHVAEHFGVVGWDGVEPMPEGVTHFVLNPDSIKEMMIDEGMLLDGVSDKIRPLEQVSFIHAESNFLTAMFFRRMAELGYNVVYDTTMANVPHVKKNLGPLYDAGYRLRGLYIDIPLEESQSSARRRYLRDWQNPNGGRFVPSEASTAWNTRQTFEDMTEWFDEWAIVDNTGVSEGHPRAVIIAQGTEPIVRPKPKPYSRSKGGSQSLSLDDFLTMLHEDDTEYEPLPDDATAAELERLADIPGVTIPGVTGSLHDYPSDWEAEALIRRGRPEEALQLILAGQIPAPTHYDDERDAEAWPSLFNELYATGRYDLAPAFSEAITAMRQTGEPLMAAIDWDPLLHPRGRDGRFIEVGGWIRGLLRFKDGQRESRGQVVRILANQDDPESPLILVDVGNGQTAVAEAGNVEQAVSTKAQISGEWSEPPDPAVLQEMQDQVDVLRARYPDVPFDGVVFKPGLINDTGHFGGKDNTHVYFDDSAGQQAIWDARIAEFDGALIDPSAAGTVLHEHAHILDGYLLRTNRAAYDELSDYLNEEIEVPGLGRVRRLEHGLGAPSPYGASNRYEYVAEALSDWDRNGPDAKPTSQWIGRHFDLHLGRADSLQNDPAGQIKQLQTELYDLLGGQTISEAAQKHMLNHSLANAAEEISTKIGRVLDEEIHRRLEENGGPKLLIGEQWQIAADKMKQEVLQITHDHQDGKITDAEKAAALADWTDRWDKLERNRHIYRTAYAEVARQVLAEFVPGGVGGQMKVSYWNVSDKDIEAHKKIMEDGALQIYPTRWIDFHHNTHPKLSIAMGEGKGYYYQPGSGQMRLPTIDNPMLMQTTVHEFGHRMEASVPGLRQLEGAFYWRRVGNESAKVFKAGGMSFITREDEFPTPYMGRDYKGMAYELMTVGAEAILSPYAIKGTFGVRGLLEKDDDYRAWLLGLFVSITPDPPEMA